MGVMNDTATFARRMGTDAQPTVRLGARPQLRDGTRQWEGLPQALISGDERLDYDRPYAVLGGPGTGKTSLLVDTAVEFLASGGDADNVMFFAATKDSAARIRGEVFDRLKTSEAYAATGSPVRSVHSWAFAFYRAIRQARGESMPRLVTGAEHDAHIRLLLRGQLAAGRREWPEDIMPAVGFVGFARQLRDLLLRATERGLSAEKLARYGDEYHRPMWQAAGRFLQEYEQVRALSESDNLNASELLHAVLDEMHGSEEGGKLLDAHRERTKLILVDDAHNLDPAAARFIESFIAPGVRWLIAGDPDQCVFHFRGADEAFLRTHAAEPTHRVVLSHSHRMTHQQVQAVAALTEKLPHIDTRVPVHSAGLKMPAVGEDGLREQQTEKGSGLASPQETGGGDVSGLQVVVADSATAERLHVADIVRRAHVERGVSWDDIAVVVRSTAQISSLRRVLLSHGVPVTVDSTSLVLAEQPMVASLLLAMEGLDAQLSTSHVRALMESAVGGADPIMVRRVERALTRALAHARVMGQEIPTGPDGLPYRALDCLRDLVNQNMTQKEYEEWTAYMGPRELEVIGRVTRILQAGRDAIPQGVEMVLWKMWQATELATQLQTRALRGGTTGSQADQDLDAVMNLFDYAGDFAERFPHASVQTFVEEVKAQELPTGTRDRRKSQLGAVEVLPAHATAGRQWDVVVVSGVNEDIWPAGPTVGGLFGQSELVDLIDHGIEPGTPVSRIAPALAEERRLFLLAISRARLLTAVTAVSNEHGEGTTPSRFLQEIHSYEAPATQQPAALAEQDGGEPTVGLPRVLALEPLLAELRDAVADSARPTPEREAAARNLARLIRAGVFGADPDQWWGARGASSDTKIVREDGSIRLSPSRLGNMADCQLKAFFDRYRGIEAQTHHMRIGTAIHAIAEAIVAGLSVEDAQRAAAFIVPRLMDGPEWSKLATAKRWTDGVVKLHSFITTAAAAPGSSVVSERSIEVPLGHTPEGEPITLAGRIDLQVIDADGNTTVYDFKTAKTAASAHEAAESPQLAAYQFMIMRTEGLHNNGAALVFPGADGAKAVVREQARLSEDELAERATTMVNIAAGSAGPSFVATPGKHCDYCDLTALCPAKTEGRMLV